MSRIPWGTFFKFGTNVYLDSQMNWLRCCDLDIFTLWRRFLKNPSRDYLQIKVKGSLGLKDYLIGRFGGETLFCLVNVLSEEHLERILWNCMGWSKVKIKKKKLGLLNNISSLFLGNFFKFLILFCFAFIHIEPDVMTGDFSGRLLSGCTHFLSSHRIMPCSKPHPHPPEHKGSRIIIKTNLILFLFLFLRWRRKRRLVRSTSRLLRKAMERTSWTRTPPYVHPHTL